METSSFPEVSLVRLASWLTRTVAGLLRGVFGIVVKFCLLIFIMFFFFKDGPALLDSVKKAIPVNSTYQDKVIDTFQKVSKSIVRGTLGTALGQGAVATIGFSLPFIGLGTPLFWGALVTLSALVPVVGTTLVTIPLILSRLLETGGPDWPEAIALTVLASVVALLDNVLRPMLLKDGLHLHPLWILLSILGGVNYFGGLGLVLGPMVVVFIGTFLALVTEESRAERETAQERKRPASQAG